MKALAVIGASFIVPIKTMRALVASAHTFDRRYWNVKDFGAKGDGITDDSQAFYKALNEAGHADGGIVYVPPGHYRTRL